METEKWNAVSERWEMSSVKKNIWVLLISLIMIATGVYVLFNPVETLLAMALYLGVSFAVMGVAYIIAFTKEKVYMSLTLGILDLVIGLIFLLNLGVTAMTIPLIFALWCLFVGIVQIVTSLELKENMIPSWSWLLCTGILGVLFSLLIFFYPMIGILTLTLLMGTYLLLYGALELVRYLKGV